MVNFSKENFKRLKELAIKALFDNVVIQTRFGQQLNVYELIYTTSINQLSELKSSFEKKLEKENKKEWVQPDESLIEYYKFVIELVNLTIGYKRYKLEVQEAELRRESLEAQLNELKESQKTPTDRIKELEAELEKLSKTEL